MGHRAPPELHELASQIGKVVEHWGFKEIHGRIWSYIYLSKEPIDSTTLVRRLNVSKALVSLAVKDLLKYRVITVAGKGHGRKILLQSNPDLYQIICNFLKNREMKMLTRCLDAYAEVEKLDCSTSNIDIDRQQLENLGRLIKSASENLGTIIDHEFKVSIRPHSE